MERYNNFLQILLTAVLSTAAATGCVQDSADIGKSGGGDGKTLTVQLDVPSYELPEAVTRGIGDVKDEALVQSIDLLIFDKSSPMPQLMHVHTTTAANIRQSDSPPYYKVSFDMNYDLLEDAGTLAVVANATDAVRAAIEDWGAPSEGRKDKASIMSYLRYSLNPDSDGRYQWNSSESSFTAIPMYGEMAVTGGLSPGTTVSGIQLTRMLARIDIKNEVAGDIFTLKEIYIVNYEGGGAIAPNWDPATGVVYKPGESGYIYETNTDPDIPDTAPKPQPPTQQNALKYTYEQTGNDPGPMMEGEIYTFEAVKGPADDPTGRVGMILKGDYRGSEYYYKVDFTCSADIGNSAKKGDLMPLYRNHKYVISITDAEGVGYGSFDEALNSEGVLSNLRTSIMVVDANGMTSIVYNGQYYLAVMFDKFEFPQLETFAGVFPVVSNYTGPWKAEITDPAASPWLRFFVDENNDGEPDESELRTSLTGTDINTSELAVALLRADSPGEGKFTITAGRLTHTITMNRPAPSLTKRFALSNVVVDANGQLNFAVDENFPIAANVIGLMFKWGSLVGMSPAGNPYDPATAVMYAPSGVDRSEWTTGMAGWDKIPYGHEIFGFSSVPGDYNTDAFKDYNNGTGFDEDLGVGDICRYIASKGWVKGNWRMPTYAEWMMLLDVSRDGGVSYGPFTDRTSAINTNPTSGVRRGMYLTESGYFLGDDIDTSSPSSPPPGTIFLPASGHRYPNGNGDVVHVAAYGYYWSATPFSTNTINYLFQAKWGVDTNDADRSYAFPVRCIMDYYE